MMRHFRFFLACILAGIIFLTSAFAQPDPAAPVSIGLWGPIQKTIEGYLGRPYVLGAVGKKSFDCSGFVWRIMVENGIILKRTTARKLYLCLPDAPKESSYHSGSLVFFDNMKHVGIVKDRQSFYHAQVRKGTNLSTFDPFWRREIYGFKNIPIRE
jgi:cell wall-associated NlpC family hydrolase